MPSWQNIIYHTKWVAKKKVMFKLGSNLPIKPCIQNFDKKCFSLLTETHKVARMKNYEIPIGIHWSIDKYQN